jgi:hypothetical protein
MNELRIRIRIGTSQSMVNMPHVQILSPWTISCNVEHGHGVQATANGKTEASVRMNAESA